LDVLYGGFGNDRVKGGSGNDLVLGSPGDDKWGDRHDITLGCERIV